MHNALERTFMRILRPWRTLHVSNIAIRRLTMRSVDASLSSNEVDVNIVYADGDINIIINESNDILGNMRFTRDDTVVSSSTSRME
jgi:hypothetical protein